MPKGKTGGQTGGRYGGSDGQKGKLEVKLEVDMEGLMVKRSEEWSENQQEVTRFLRMEKQ